MTRWRTAEGKERSKHFTPGADGMWLRLERCANEVTALASADGRVWQTLGSEILALPEVGGEGDDLAIVGLLEPLQDDGGVEAAGIGQDDPLHYAPFTICESFCSIVTAFSRPRHTSRIVSSPGDFFGEMALLTGELRNATCRAATPCALYELRRAVFQIVPLPDVPWFQQKLAQVGYQTPQTGVMDTATREVISTFQMKYRPRDISGTVDAETAALIEVASTPATMRVAGNPEGETRPYTSRW
mgnify:CR=1 FL=1